jgi:hypothetical protein
LSATASAWQKGIHFNNHFNGNVKSNGNINTNTPSRRSLSPIESARQANLRRQS